MFYTITTRGGVVVAVSSYSFDPSVPPHELAAGEAPCDAAAYAAAKAVLTGT